MYTQMLVLNEESLTTVFECLITRVEWHCFLACRHSIMLKAQSALPLDCLSHHHTTFLQSHFHHTSTELAIASTAATAPFLLASTVD